jgi:hypothetical protein
MDCVPHAVKRIIDIKNPGAKVSFKELTDLTNCYELGDVDIYTIPDLLNRYGIQMWNIIEYDLDRLKYKCPFITCVQFPKHRHNYALHAIVIHKINKNNVIFSNSDLPFNNIRMKKFLRYWTHKVICKK